MDINKKSLPEMERPAKLLFDFSTNNTFPLAMDNYCNYYSG